MQDGFPLHITPPPKQLLNLYFGNDRAISRHFPTDYAPQERQETETIKIRDELVNVSRQLQASRQPAKRDSGISPTYSTFQSIWHTQGKSLADKILLCSVTLYSHQESKCPPE
ncbi:hypothetical protein CEXT_62051 [Caerostris extrusa]|uniref:Uncharacterized protein n=1 Tax=Caerostris extrusa TaxID=172846 RepID=A0AAV4RCT9_CAEEX|nr:hypothetical protein CEXT_62051 [Caerostris extrusa]